MSHKRKPGFEIVHSGTWWKEFHEARRARAHVAHTAQYPSNNGDALTGNVYTFVPGCAAPFVQVAGAPRATRKSAPSFSAARITSTRNASIAPRGSNSILACRTHEENNVLVRLARTRAERDASFGIGRGDDVLKSFVASRNRAKISMARKGYLQEPGNFEGKTDDEILAHLKTQRGQQQLAAVQENSRCLGTEVREQAIAAALKTRRR
ncbi:hypothetical protein B0H14DRAFT_3461000 [Mycena olivaceomarginata]|nr:hypothetical protein B0H14DRAFT_3461000 [Mycena olivaceomarginata]